MGRGRRRVADQHAEVVAARGAGRNRLRDRQRDVELQRLAAERAEIDRIIVEIAVGRSDARERRGIVRAVQRAK